MSHYAVIYTYADDAEAIAEHRPHHRAYLAELASEGFLVASGPLMGTSPATALLIFEVEAEEKVRGLLTGDPFQQLGLVAQTDVAQWDPVIGIFAGK